MLTLMTVEHVGRRLTGGCENSNVIPRKWRRKNGKDIVER